MGSLLGSAWEISVWTDKASHLTFIYDQPWWAQKRAHPTKGTPMQLVKTHRDALLRPLQIVSGIVERRHTLPILANILIRKEGEKVSFLSTDIEVQITTSTAIGSGDKVIATTVAARKLLDILRALPESEVTLTLKDKRLTVQSGKS